MVTRYEDGTYGMVQFNDCSTVGNYAVYRPNNQWQPKQVDMSEIVGKIMHLQQQPRQQEAEWNKQPKEKKMANTNKRGLYQVILVNPKESKIIFNGFVICDKVEDVLLEADAGKVIKEASLSVSEVDKIINFMGEIRKTKRNKDGVLELVSEEKE